MKSKFLFSNTIQIFVVLLALGMFSISCSKENVEVINDDKEIAPVKGGGESFDFFNIYGSDYEDLFTEEVWNLMNSNPQDAMLALTGVEYQPPIGNHER